MLRDKGEEGMSEPLKVGLVGAGGIANSHIRAYLEYPEQVRVTAVCDIIEEAASAYAKRVNADAVYTDLDAMLRDADIEAVDLCHRHDLHAPHAIAAAQAGKHVIVEKPMANSVQDCREMVEAAGKSGVTLMVAQHLRYMRTAAAAKRLIEDGKLGRIEAVRTHMISGGYGRMDRQGHWMRDPKYAGGGVMMTTQVHHFDLLRYYVGDVKRVYGICRTLGPDKLAGAEDLVAATLEFENGAVGHTFAKSSLSREGRSYCLMGSEGTLYAELAVESDETPTPHFGTLMVSLKTPEKEREYLDNVAQMRQSMRGNAALRNEFIRKLQPDFEPLSTEGTGLATANGFVNEILHFAECCRSGAEPISSGRDNVNTVEVIMGIYESSRTGMPVDLDTL